MNNDSLGPIAIVGAHGMLGQDLAKAFSGRPVELLDKSDVDITNFAEVKTVLGEIGPSVVINAAAYNAVDDAEGPEGERIARLVNTEGPRNLATACRAMNVPFVHYSSDYVFKGDADTGYTEEDAPDPQSAYAQSKYDGERAVQEVGGEAYIIRTCRLFGSPGASEQSKQSFVDVMLSLAEDRDFLEVIDAEVASPTYTVDLAQQTVHLVDGDYEPGVYHATNTGSCTWYEFAVEIFAVAGVEIEVRPVGPEAYPRPAARPANSTLHNTKLPQMRSWQEALADYISHR